MFRAALVFVLYVGKLNYTDLRVTTHIKYYKQAVALLAEPPEDIKDEETAYLQRFYEIAKEIPGRTHILRSS